MFLLWASFRIYHAINIYNAEQKYELAMAQCEKYGGMHGELPIEAEGVLDTKGNIPKGGVFGRSYFFLNQGLKYVELSSNTIRYQSSEFAFDDPQIKPYSELFDYYRVSIVEKGNELCVPYERIMKRGSHIIEQLELDGSECLAVVGFDDASLLKAPYELRQTRNVIDEGVAIDWTNVELVDRQNNLVVASYNWFFECFTAIVGGSERTSCSNSKTYPKVLARCPLGQGNITPALNEFQQNLFTNNGER